MPGYGESIGSVGVGYAGKAQLADPGGGAGTATLGPVVALGSEPRLERTERRCAARAGRSDDRGAASGGPS